MSSSKETKIINLYAGPGSGKSTTAARLFALMKDERLNVELVTEYAKDKVWEESLAVLGNQIYVFGKQWHRIYRLIDKVDYIVTDSPLLISLYYGKNLSESFKNVVYETYQAMNNIDVFLKRVKPYTGVGRLQTEEEAKQIDVDLRSILDSRSVAYHEIEADSNSAREIIKLI